MSRIKARFEKLKKEGGKAFIAYIMAGDPALETTAQHIRVLDECGADIIELGVPFSDPVADGPVIQAAAERALRAGVSLSKVLSFVKEVRKETQIPLVLMTYYNPVFRYGVGEFFRDAADAGVDGIIIPDMTVEESPEITGPAAAHGIDTIFLAAPTSGDERLKKVAKVSTGFIYFVSITGITGAKLVLSEAVKDSVKKLKDYSLNKKPVAIGFGVSTPEEAAEAAKLADGVIIGSAIVKKAAERSEEAFRGYLKALRAAIK